MPFIDRCCLNVKNSERLQLFFTLAFVVALHRLGVQFCVWKIFYAVYCDLIISTVQPWNRYKPTHLQSCQKEKYQDVSTRFSASLSRLGGSPQERPLVSP